jgi:hypothetical protein
MVVRFARAVAEDGTELHFVTIPPPALPRVQKRDLEQAWEQARDAAASGCGGRRRGFRFRGGPDVGLDDRDARTWADSVDRAADLSTPHGVSLCLRLLGLVDLLGRALWPARYLRIRGGEADIDGALLGAAAATRLTDTGALDETAMRAMLGLSPDAADDQAETGIRCIA